MQYKLWRLCFIVAIIGSDCSTPWKSIQALDHFWTITPKQENKLLTLIAVNMNIRYYLAWVSYRPYSYSPKYSPYSSCQPFILFYGNVCGCWTTGCVWYVPQLLSHAWQLISIFFGFSVFNFMNLPLSRSKNLCTSRPLPALRCLGDSYKINLPLESFTVEGDGQKVGYLNPDSMQNIQSGTLTTMS